MKAVRLEPVVTVGACRLAAISRVRVDARKAGRGVFASGGVTPVAVAILVGDALQVVALDGDALDDDALGSLLDGGRATIAKHLELT